MTPHDPNLFFVVGHREAVHGGGAGSWSTAATTARWKWRAKDAAMADFVSLLMGVPPSDPTSGKLVEILNRHYMPAMAAKEMPSDALRSAFTLACSSPLAVSSGI